MRFLRLLLASVAFAATAGGAYAVEPKDGVDYLTLAQPVQADTGKKVEVVEVFMYHCPHCNALDPLLRSEERRVGKECRSRCDWSSDVCSSDLPDPRPAGAGRHGQKSRSGRSLHVPLPALQRARSAAEIGRASCRERV